MSEHIYETKLVSQNDWEIYFPINDASPKEEIIRCRDCRYLNEYGECTNDIWDGAYREDYPYVAGEGDGTGFCAWAESKE